ncbi:MAG: hypothetical protein J6W06_01330 [Bacteroidales bacterium]|jgi:DNA-binding NarL/FixJ family response regulator|nr:hypothetical protein [Bacteroidales bacterium]
MKSTTKINIYLVDNDVLFLDDFSEQFACEHLHILYTFSSVQKFLANLKEIDNNYFSIVIINDMIISHGLNTKSVVEILPMIKNIDKETSVIVLTDNYNRELKLSASDLLPDAYIKNDNMLYFKLAPTINRIICNYELKKRKLDFRIAIFIAIAVIIITIIQIITASIIS